MSNYQMLLLQSNGKTKRFNTNALTMDFAALRVGADTLAIQQGGTGAGAYLDIGARALRSSFTATDAADLVNKATLEAAIAGFSAGMEWQDSVLTRASAPAGGEANGSRILVTELGFDEISAVNTGTKTFTLAGVDYTTVIGTGDVIKVRGSTGNDGWYTVVSSSFSTDTSVVVSETIPDGTADGSIYWADGDFRAIGVDVVAKKDAGTWSVGFIPTSGSAIIVDDEVNAMYIYGQSSWAKRFFESTTGSNGIKKIGFDIQRDDADTFTNNEGGAIVVNEFVSITGGNAAKAIATDAALFDKMIGVVEDASIADTASGKIIIRQGAYITGLSGLTGGQDYYVSNVTAGAIGTWASMTWAPGDVVYKVGRAISATVLLLDPKFEYVY